MSEKEKQILETMTKAIPNMSEFDKGYLLGMGEVTESEFVKRYNTLIEKESEKHREPFQPHEHI